MRKLLLLILPICCFASSFSQPLSNVKALFENEEVVVSYDLIGSDPGQKFDIRLFSSHDGFQEPLQAVSGLVGLKVNQGRGNRIVWNAKSALPARFDDDVTFKIKAVPVEKIIFFNVSKLPKSSYKRGKGLEVSWEGGFDAKAVDIDLLRDGNVVQQIADGTSNARNFSYLLPNTVKTGKGYRLRIANAANNEESGLSNAFRIKAKIPLLLKLSPFFVVGAILPFIGGSSKESLENSNVLPGPIEPQ